MRTTDIISQLENQGIEDESLIMYSNILTKVNDLSSISSFKVGIDTSPLPGISDSNITIITFHNLPKSTIRQDIIKVIENLTDEAFEYKYLSMTDTLILSFNF